MATTKTTVALAAAVAFAVGVGLTAVTAATLSATTSDGDVAARGGTANAASGDGAGRAPRARSVPRTGAASASDSSWLADLGVRDDERPWVRDLIVKERERREAGAIRDTDGGIEIVSKWLEHGAEVEPVVASFEAMAGHVRGSAGPASRVEASGPATGVDLGAAAGGASAIEFGPGRFVVSGGRTQWGGNVRAPLESLEIRGAGADRTTLVASARLIACYGAQGDLRNVVVRDVTIESGRDSVLCVFGAAAVTFERVRFVTSAPALYLSGAAYVACRDCTFDGAGDAFAAALQGPSIVLFERCRFAGWAAAVGGGGARSGGRPSVARFLDCRFEDVRLADSRIRPGRLEEVDLRVRGGESLSSPPAWTDEQRRTWWGAGFAATADGVRFASLPPRFTVGDALRAIDAADSAGAGRVVGVAVVPGRRDEPTTLEVATVAEGRSDAAWRVVRYADGVLTDLPRAEPRQHSLSVRSPRDLDGLRPLAELIRLTGLGEGEPVTWAGLDGRWQSGGVQVPYASVTSDFGTRVALDGRTGNRLPAGW